MVINKRHWHHVWRYLRKIHPWYFLALTLIMGAICVVALRHNNQQMIKLRDAVYAADKNNGNIEDSLQKLRSYVYSHMNTSLATGTTGVYPPIQLKYQYQRLQTTAQEKAGQSNESLYTDAETYCQQQDSTDFYGYYRLPCVNQYVTSHGVAYAPPATVPAALYKFDFTAAKWSPDLAGWALVVTILSAICFVVTFVYHWWAKRYL